ncbi:MAG: hypothetical protein ACO3E8_03965 [Candidatus Methylacidiphilales bacterium]
MINKLLGLAVLGCVMGLATVVRAGDSCGGCPADEKKDKDSKESTSEKQ